ncbi:MAG TPA: condensation domain-containing protein, partial [Longimicrobiaceae bacterium]|nr:condensation domain-containing protein [Longimicrobiaceae bacterium]
MSSGPTEQTLMSPEEKRRLLAKLLQKKAGEAKTYPVSFSQRRFWFLDQLEPGNPVYNIAVPDAFPGDWDIDVVRRAVNEIVRRHGSLRTVFRTVDEEPVQHVLPVLEIDVPFIDLSGLPPEEVRAESGRIATGERMRAFDLEHGPLIRCTFVKLGPGSNVFILCTHHIVGDGWSNGIFLNELRVLCAAFAAGEPSPLPPLPIQYHDFALWQREQVSGEALERQLEYWRGQLAGAAEVLELPTDRPRPPTQRYEGATTKFLVPLYTVDALNALTREEGASLFMTLLAAFQVVLSRWSGQTSVVVGTPIAGRTRPEVERLIGFFVNTLALHTDLSGDPSFREAVRRVRTTMLGAYGHQEIPFDLLVDELGVER